MPAPGRNMAMVSPEKAKERVRSMHVRCGCEIKRSKDARKSDSSTERNNAMPQERHVLEQESDNEASQRKIEDRESENQEKGFLERLKQNGVGHQEKKEHASAHQGWDEDTLTYDETRKRKGEKTSSGNLRSRSEPEAAADGEEGAPARMRTDRG